jgi:hypothetical protein
MAGSDANTVLAKLSARRRPFWKLAPESFWHAREQAKSE